MQLYNQQISAEQGATAQSGQTVAQSLIHPCEKCHFNADDNGLLLKRETVLEGERFSDFVLKIP